MTDGQVKVTVYDVRGHAADLNLTVNERGNVAFDPPPPGGFEVDPAVQLPDLLNMLVLLQPIGLKAQRRQGEP